MDQAAAELALKGTLRGPAAPWLRESEVLLCTRRSCGWNRNDTPESMLEGQIQHRGWAWRWEGEDLVLELPGWAPPVSVVVVAQAGLFE